MLIDVFHGSQYINIYTLMSNCFFYLVYFWLIVIFSLGNPFEWMMLSWLVQIELMVWLNCMFTQSLVHVVLVSIVLLLIGLIWLIFFTTLWQIQATYSFSFLIIMFALIIYSLSHIVKKTNFKLKTSPRLLKCTVYECVFFTVCDQSFHLFRWSNADRNNNTDATNGDGHDIKK